VPQSKQHQTWFYGLYSWQASTRYSSE